MDERTNEALAARQSRPSKYINAVVVINHTTLFHKGPDIRVHTKAWVSFSIAAFLATVGRRINFPDTIPAAGELYRKQALQ